MNWSDVLGIDGSAIVLISLILPIRSGCYFMPSAFPLSPYGFDKVESIRRELKIDIVPTGVGTMQKLDHNAVDGVM